MRDLFSDNETCHQLDLIDAEVTLYPYFLNIDEADEYLRELLSQVSWSEQTINVYGKVHKVPRLSAWYADDNKSYEYSGIRSSGLAWIDVLSDLKNKIQIRSEASFNSVLVNRYRNGNDSVGWHADDEPELGTEPVIASLSLGEERVFQMKHRNDKTLKKSITLPHGSLLLMRGKTQEHWLHQIAKSSRDMSDRINLTFRTVNN